MRALVSRVFTPRAVTALEPMIREVICSFLDPLNDAAEFDAVADFSAPFPVEVISRMLGVPEGERQQIRHWLDASLRREPGQIAPSPENEQAVLESGMYFHELTVEKRKNPGDDMLSRLTQVTVDRGDGVETGLDDVEITGFRDAPRRRGRGDGDEARRQRGGAVLAAPRSVAEDPRRPRQDPRAPSTRSSATGRRRSTRAGTAWRSASSRAARSPQGFPVLLITGAATRDPRAFERADEFDIERQPGITIGFGHGVHSCLGAALARMESRIAIEELAKRWRRLEVDEAGLRRVHMANVAGYSNVPVHGATPAG